VYLKTDPVPDRLLREENAVAQIKGLYSVAWLEIRVCGSNPTTTGLAGGRQSMYCFDLKKMTYFENGQVMIGRRGRVTLFFSPAVVVLRACGVTHAFATCCRKAGGNAG